MKKQMILMLALVLAASFARADFVQVGVFGGYTTVAMDDVQDVMKSVREMVPSGVNVDMTEPTNGYVIGLDAHFKPFPFLMAGARLEYIGVNTAKLSADGLGSQEMQFGLMPIMVGIKAGIKPPLTGLSIGAGLHVGYGLAHASQRMEEAGLKVDVPLDGGGFVAELSGELQYTIFPLVKFDFLLGYRLAKISKMKYTGSYLITGNQDGATFTKPGTDDAVAVDFSGINVAAGISVGF